MSDTRPFDPALFGEAAVDAETATLNAQLVELLTGQPEWWIVGAEATRAARRRGEGPFPAPVMSSRARTMTITGKDGNEIPLRIIAPAQPRGIYLHLHGGGWVLGGADTQDPMLERIADNTGQVVVSVEYRLLMIAPQGDVVEAAGKVYSQRTWHGRVTRSLRLAETERSAFAER